MSTDATEDDMDLARTEEADLDLPSAQVLLVAPHTPNPWGHVELVQKTWVLGSGNWVGLRSAKSGEG